MSNQTICLNMIVKDESHVIEETLEKLCGRIKFDYWVICDTGSSDDTPNIIKNFFEKKNIKGELYFDEWKDFAHNRTLALKYAYGKTDYLLVFDADDEIYGDFNLPEKLTFDAYQFNFGSEGLKYGRILLINNKKKFNFVGVLHEYMNFADKDTEYTMTQLEGNYYVISGRKGNRNKDPQKYLKDALILEKAYQEEFENKNDIYKRYAFYCGNSYFDYNDKDNALIWYKKTLEISDNTQEKYISAKKIYEIYKEKKLEEMGIPYLIMGLHYDNERLECLYHLIMYYVKLEMFDIACNFFCFTKFLNNLNYSSKMLSEPKIYEYDIPNIMIYVGGKLGKTELIHEMYNIIFKKKFKYFKVVEMRNLLVNHNIFVKLFDKDNHKKLELFNEYIDFLKELKIDLKPYENYISKSRFYLSLDEKYKIVDNDKKNILIYVGNSPFNWNLTFAKKNAIGGSEFCACSLAESLSKDYNVFVLGKVENENINNIYFINIDDNNSIITKDFLLQTTQFEFTIVSRFLDFFISCREIKTKNIYLWAHDCGFAPTQGAKEILKYNNSKIDCCICLTEWHKKLFEEKYPSLKNKIKVIGNGLILEEFPQKTEKIKNRFIYTSSSERGLINIVKRWKEITEILPDAELYIASYNKFPDKNKKEDGEIYEIMKNYNNIKHLGKLNKKELYELMAVSEYWFYPTTFPETFCITAMEMLKSGVICIYYPIAGLINTIGQYGFSVSKDTEMKNIKQITSLPEKEKNIIRQKGIEYANNMSWENKTKEWILLNSFINNITFYKASKNIAIYNSFPFHYEMFGYIIFYCYKNNYNLVIFTNDENDMGWLDFYKKKFSDYNFEYKNINKFEFNKDLFDIIFITTDDDHKFKNEWINNKCITIDHTLENRRPQIKNHIGTRKFLNSNNKWALPCYEGLKISEKINNKEKNINIAIIGCTKININIINRLSVSDEYTKINLHVCGRKVHYVEKNKIKNNINIENNVEMNTNELFELLKKCDYILTDCCPNIIGNFDHTQGKSMSGAIPLSFTTLTPLIINSENNELYKFKNVIEFENDSLSDICVDKGKINIYDLEKERSELILMFDENISFIFKDIIPKKIIQTWEHKNFEPEFQKIINTWKINNPTFEHCIFDKDEREEFIKNNFDEDVFNTYQSIIPGAYKVDLFRYCYLYIYGGIYVDVDTVCMGNLNNFLLSDVDFVVPIDLNINPNEGEHNLACGFIASIPKHPILLDCINTIVHNIKNNIVYKSKLDFTGPGLLGRCVNKYIGNIETESFINKEGIYNKIHFLKFEKNTEYIKNLNGDILFQNKNGNQQIINLYNIECSKLKNYVGWVNCQNNVNYTLKKKI